MPTVRKEELVDEIKDRFNGSEAVIMADYRGLTVKEMQQLRSQLREAGGEIKVYKNSLTEIAIRELALPNMDEYLAGPTAFVFIAEDPGRARQGAHRVRQGAPGARAQGRPRRRTRSSMPTASRPSRRCRRARSSSPSCSAPC